MYVNMLRMLYMFGCQCTFSNSRNYITTQIVTRSPCNPHNCPEFFLLRHVIGLIKTALRDQAS